MSQYPESGQFPVRVKDSSGLRMVYCYILAGALFGLRNWQDFYLYTVRNLESAVPFLPVPAIAVVGLCLLSVALAVAVNDTMNVVSTRQNSGIFGNIDPDAILATIMALIGMFSIGIALYSPHMRGTPVSLLITLSLMFFSLGLGLMFTNKR